MATQEGTRKYFEKADREGIEPRRLGRTGLWVSPIGFGGYRVHDTVEEHRDALRHALLNGVNLVDTSSNYTDGGSERLIGSVLEELSANGELDSEGVVVVSKVGYVQGENLEIATKRQAEGRPFPDMVPYADGCWHCIHPEFLADQLERSLDRLRLSCLDVYLLHNPEYFLSDAKNRGADLAAARAEYDRRIQAAFEWLEEQVRIGTIQTYGISSNTFPSPSHDAEFTSLDRVLEIARSITAEPHFSVIQFPFNLYEAGALFEKNQRQDSQTLVERAREANLGTLINRPLNAMGPDGGLVRLASFRETPAHEVQTVFDQQLQRLRELEETLIEELLPELGAEGATGQWQQAFAWGKRLEGTLQMFHHRAHWDHVHQNLILPNVVGALRQLDEAFRDQPQWGSWYAQYATALNTLLEAITRHYDNLAQEKSKEISARLDQADPELRSSATLSQKVLRSYLGVDGIDCVLLGMRRVQYVDDALTALRAGPVGRSREVLQAFSLTRRE